jgi:hypothetical protein
MVLSKEDYQAKVKLIQDLADDLSHHDPVVIQAVYPDKYERLWEMLKATLTQMSNSTGIKVNSQKSENEAMVKVAGYLLDMMEGKEREVK